MTVQALRGREPQVLDDLLATYGPEIQGVAFLILRDRQAAEDVVVDTLLTALERGGQLRDASALRAWLLRIATNRALSVRRTNARIVQLHIAPERPAVVVDDDQRLALLASLEQLAPRMRAAVVLRYYADLSVRETAEALGTSENTVKTQLREALVHMRRALAEPAPLGEAAHG
jgi:RNA polymerase sigma factor (sigma-70 family)